VSASFFRNEETFLKLCQEWNRIFQNRTQVALFRESCIFRGTPEWTLQGRSADFNPQGEIQEIQKQQEEMEF